MSMCIYSAICRRKWNRKHINENNNHLANFEKEVFLAEESLFLWRKRGKEKKIRDTGVCSKISIYIKFWVGENIFFVCVCVCGLGTLYIHTYIVCACAYKVWRKDKNRIFYCKFARRTSSGTETLQFVEPEYHQGLLSNPSNPTKNSLLLRIMYLI